MGRGRRAGGLGLACCGFAACFFSTGAIAQAVYATPPAGLGGGGGTGFAVPGVNAPGGTGFGVPGANAPGAAGAPGPAAAAQPAWSIVPAIEVGEAYNDNVALAPRHAEVADFITAITPSVAFTGNTSRLRGYLLYDPQELIFARGTSHPTLQQRLLGLGNAEVLPELLFFEARAAIDQGFVNSAGPIGQTTLTTNNNLQTVETASGSPYLVKRFGPYFTSETRYTFSTVTTSGNTTTIAPEQIHELRQRITSGDDFQRLIWAVTGDAIEIDRLRGTTDPLGGTTSKDEYGKVDLRYPIVPTLSVIGMGGYERISDPILTLQPRGPIWSAGLAYEPRPDLSAFASYGRRFDRSDVEFLGSYTPDPGFEVRGLYTLSFQTGQSTIAANLNQATTGPNGTLVNSQTGQPFTPVNNSTPGTPSSEFGIDSGSFFQKRLEADLFATRDRNTYSFSAYDVKVSGDPINVQTERIFGGTLGWGRQLQPSLSLSTGATYYRALFQDGSGRRDNSYALSLALAYILSPTITTRLGVTRSDTMSNVAADSIVNDIVLVSIRKQF